MITIFVDLKKPFDIINHFVVDLLRSYLTNRNQTIKIHQIFGNTRTIEYGVPQETVFGPVLFNIYLNDLFGIEIDADIATYADNTAILFEDDKWQSLKVKAVNGNIITNVPN